MAIKCFMILQFATSWFTARYCIVIYCFPPRRRTPAAPAPCAECSAFNVAFNLYMLNYYNILEAFVT